MTHFGQKKNHQQLMKELSLMAKDLENYNASQNNKTMNARARSMILSEK